MNNILAIDTSLRNCGIGVMCNNEVIFNQMDEMPRGQDKWLAAKVKQALKKVHLNLDDLNAIAVTTGPGSFTGIRVGIAFARGLASVLDIPLIGLTSCEIFSHGMSQIIMTVIEIKRDAFVAQVFQDQNPQTELIATDQKGLKDLMMQWSIQKLITHSDHVIDLLESKSKKEYPNPKHMLEMARLRLSENKLQNIVRPVYIRSADVTIKNE